MLSYVFYCIFYAMHTYTNDVCGSEAFALYVWAIDRGIRITDRITCFHLITVVQLLEFNSKGYCVYTVFFWGGGWLPRESNGGWGGGLIDTKTTI